LNIQIVWIKAYPQLLIIVLKYLAKNLKLLRESKEIKQNETHTYIGFKPTTWNNYEREVSKPNLDDLIRISKYFGVSETQLLHEDLAKAGNLIKKGGGGKSEDNGKVNGNGISNLSVLNEEAEGYKTLLELKDQVILDKEKIITTQQEQIDALKLAVSQMKGRLQERNKKR
jgi:transcriptional regulator with XRE-family HTH domain